MLPFSRLEDYRFCSQLPIVVRRIPLAQPPGYFKTIIEPTRARFGSRDIGAFNIIWSNGERGLLIGKTPRSLLGMFS
jgi:hypothetical protein